MDRSLKSFPSIGVISILVVLGFMMPASVGEGLVGWIVGRYILLCLIYSFSKYGLSFFGAAIQNTHTYTFTYTDIVMVNLMCDLN